MEELNESIINSSNSLSEKEEQVEVISSTEETQTNAADEVAEGIQQVEGSLPNEDVEEKYEEPVVDYSSCTREELLEAFRELLNDHVLRIKNRVGAIKLVFTDLSKAYQKEQCKGRLYRYHQTRHRRRKGTRSKQVCRNCIICRSHRTTGRTL